jgi:hypothetical protein
MFGTDRLALPIRDSDSPQTRAETAVQPKNPLAFDDILDSLVCGLPSMFAGEDFRESGMTSFTLFSFLVSTAALVDRKIRGLPHRRRVNARDLAHAGTEEATDYVAVIATMPPAAPAKEWITESPGIVGSRDVDGKCGFEGSSHLIRKVLEVGLMTRDIGFHERQTLDREVLGTYRLAGRWYNVIVYSGECNLIVGDTMQNIMGMFLLVSLQNPINIFVDIFRSLNLWTSEPVRAYVMQRIH